MIFLSLNNNNVSSEFKKLRLFCIVSQFNLAKPTQKATRQSGAWTPDDAIGPSMTQFPICFGSVFGDAFGLHPININIGLSNPIDIFLSFCLYFLYSPFALVSSNPNLLLCKLLDGVSCVLGCLADPRATLSVSPRYVLLAYAQVF